MADRKLERVSTTLRKSVEDYTDNADLRQHHADFLESGASRAVLIDFIAAQANFNNKISSALLALAGDDRKEIIDKVAELVDLLQATTEMSSELITELYVGAYGNLPSRKPNGE